MSIYIAGPMRGCPLFNFPAFDEARDQLTQDGWAPISPADLDREAEGMEKDDYYESDWDPDPEFLRQAMERDVAALVDKAEALCLLPGWEKSHGAKAELALAQWKNIPVFLYPSMTPIDQESVCQEAHRIQGGDRQQDYGSPKQNFEDIAKSWHAYLYIKYKGDDYHITAYDVANMMILMKMCRNLHKPKRDNWVDICGYAQCGAKVEEL